MKKLKEYIETNNTFNESLINPSLTNKILKILDGNIIDAIKKRTEQWDNAKFNWSHDPMFLIADLDINNEENTEHIRNLDWVRSKFISAYQDKITGTITNYDLLNDDGEKPCSILGIFIDRQFYPIVSIDIFKKVVDILQNDENK